MNCACLMRVQLIHKKCYVIVTGRQSSARLMIMWALPVRWHPTWKSQVVSPSAPIDTALSRVSSENRSSPSHKRRRRVIFISRVWTRLRWQWERDASWSLRLANPGFWRSAPRTHVVIFTFQKFVASKKFNKKQPFGISWCYSHISTKYIGS